MLIDKCLSAWCIKCSGYFTYIVKCYAMYEYCCWNVHCKCIAYINCRLLLSCRCAGWSMHVSTPTLNNGQTCLMFTMLQSECISRLLKLLVTDIACSDVMLSVICGMNMLLHVGHSSFIHHSVKFLIISHHALQLSRNHFVSEYIVLLVLTMLRCCYCAAVVNDVVLLIMRSAFCWNGLVFSLQCCEDWHLSCHRPLFTDSICMTTRWLIHLENSCQLAGRM